MFALRTNAIILIEYLSYLKDQIVQYQVRYMQQLPPKQKQGELKCNIGQKHISCVLEALKCSP